MKQIFIMLVLSWIFNATLPGKSLPSATPVVSSNNALMVSSASPDTLSKAVDNALETSESELTDEEIDAETYEEHSVPINFLRRLEDSIIPFTALTLSLTMPIFITLIVLVFKYKNNKRRYEIIEKALETGREIPKGLFEHKEKNTLSAGLTNIFLGIGLFVMFYALTGQFGVGSIGLLVMFIGFGELIIYFYNHPETNRNPFARTQNTSLREKEKSEKEKQANITLIQTEKTPDKPEE